jgi:hypothetical protein
MPISPRSARPRADGAVAARVRQAAHDLRRGAQREVGAARVDALGREGEVEVGAGREARLREDRREAVARRARIGRGLPHDHQPGLQHLREGLRGVEQRAKIGLAVDRERRRDADQQRVALGQRGAVAGGRDPRRHSGKDVV